ncbi:hypothetical protein DVH05_012777 [Phytophthora capsici]|nr:hypothetical protein DVH05_012777 [Phytophthora capsici]
MNSWSGTELLILNSSALVDVWSTSIVLELLSYDKDGGTLARRPTVNSLLNLEMSPITFLKNLLGIETDSG